MVKKYPIPTELDELKMFLEHNDGKDVLGTFSHKEKE